MTSSDKTKIIHPALLWILSGACVGAALLLVPRDVELLHRLIAGGKQERARELVAAAGDTEGADQLERELLGVGAGTQGAPPVPEVVEDYTKLLAFTFDSLPGGAVGEPEVERIAEVLEHCDGTRDEYELVASHAPVLPAAALERLFGIMARKALAQGDPAFAAEIYTAMRAHVGAPSAETVSAMVMAYRYSSQSLHALEVLENSLATGAGPTGEARDMLVSLYFESSQPARAFEILKAEIDEASDEAKLAELMPKAMQAAAYSGLADQLPPLLERFLGAMPENEMSFEELVAAGRSGPPAAERPFVRFGKRFAQICEWSDLHDTAFDYYCKTAALGDETSLERAIKIHTGLFRQEDMGKLLAALAPFDGPKRGDRTRLLAGLLGGAGLYEQAEAQYEEYLADAPGDIEALVALAALRAEAGDLNSALTTYRSALSEKPDDVRLRTLAAELHIALGQHEKAFALFRSIPAEAHTESTLEHYLMLADSLADPKEMNRAHRIAFNRKNDPSADDYLDLAESYALAGDGGNELLVLKGGVAARPESQKLALALADVLYRENLFDEAVRLLIRPDLKNNSRALALFIEICGGNDQFEYTATHLPKGIENHHHFSPSIRVELGQIYEETGDYSSAEALYASVPEGREAWQLLASAQYRKGDLDRAEEYQLKYLRAAIDPDAQDWMFMGDIYKSLGKIRLADEAYRRSLSILKADL